MSKEHEILQTGEVVSFGFKNRGNESHLHLKNKKPVCLVKCNLIDELKIC